MVFLGKYSLGSELPNKMFSNSKNNYKNVMKTKRTHFIKFRIKFVENLRR